MITFYFTFCCCCFFVLKICLISILVVNYKLHTFLYIIYFNAYTRLVKYIKKIYLITDSILNRQFLYSFSVQITNNNYTIHYHCNVSA